MDTVDAPTDSHITATGTDPAGADTAGTHLAAAALDLAAAGWHVFPLAGKTPRTRHGFHDATRDPAVITSWWTRWPAANIGATVPAGLLVLDVDPRHNGDRTLSALEDRHGPMPATLTAVTGRGDGGHHLYLRRPAGPLTGARLPGIDVKVSGYVVVPPSVHPDTGGTYTWTENLEPAAPPAWLVAVLRPDTTAPAATPGTDTVCSDRYGLAALAAEAATVAAAPAGARNHALNRAAFKAGQLVAAGLLTADEVTVCLLAAADTSGLLTDDGQTSCLRTIRSGLRAGQTQPRRTR